MTLRAYVRVLLYVYLTLAGLFSLFEVAYLVFYEPSPWGIQDVVRSVLAIFTARIVIVASAGIAFLYLFLKELWHRYKEGNLFVRKDKPKTFEQVFINTFIDVYSALFAFSCCLLSFSGNRAEFSIEKAIHALVTLFISAFNLILLITAIVFSGVYASVWRIAQSRQASNKEGSRDNSHQQEDKNKQAE